MEEAAQRFVPMLKLFGGGMGALSKAFYKKYGKEALPTIAGVMSQAGVEWGKVMQQTLPAKSMKAVSEQANMLGSMMGLGTQTVELSDDKWHFKMSKCPFGLEGTSKELCEAAMTMDEKRLSTFLGEAVEVKVLKSVAAGDKECEVISSKM